MSCLGSNSGLSDISLKVNTKKIFDYTLPQIKKLQRDKKQFVLLK